MRAGLSGRECVRARRRGPPLANSIQPKAPAVSDITTSGFEVTLELTFSYIVSLSVSENVSGVAIIAAFWRTLLVHVKYPHETPD